MRNKTNPTEVLKFFSLEKRRERNKKKEKKAEEAGNYDKSDKLVEKRRNFTKRVLNRRG